MRFNVLDELAGRRGLSIFAVAFGSLFLASCSSYMTRFDFPTFGLAKSENGQSNGVALSGGARLGQGGTSSATGGGAGLAEFDRERNPDLALGGADSGQLRNSYSPVQKALPEVRGARYGAVERRPLPRNEYAPRRETVATGYAAAPMRPIDEPSRSFLPSEPEGYVYEKPQTAGVTTSRNVPTSGGSKTTRQASLSLEQPAAATVQRRVTRAHETRPDDAEASEIGAIVVQPGDTLYAIGQRHGSSVVELMEINGLTDSNISAGQRLRLPAGKAVKSDMAAAVQGSDVSKSAPRAVSSGTYTVQAGDNFQSIADAVGVEAAELADINGITDTAAIRPGEVLILPAQRASASAENDSPKQKIRKVKTVRMSPVSKAAADDATEVSEAAAGDAIDVANAGADEIMPKPAKKAGGKITGFRWPVEGRIIEKFGARQDGTHNDGVNLAVPNGTKVKAAEEGVVAYAGNELKDYGNLVLIRHADGWVSAYAHNDQILVRRGDQVKRGQDIARAGNTGSVEQPQVHFELRKGSKPVDPISYMSGT